MNEQKQSKLIFSAGVARHLLKMGCTMVDIKPSREDSKMSVFVFRKDEKFDAAMEEITNEIKDKRDGEAE